MSGQTWLPVPPDSDFPIENLPFGIARLGDGSPRVVTRIGDHVLDLGAVGIAPDVTARPTLNALMESGRGAEVRADAAEVLTGTERHDAVHAVSDVEVLLPMRVGDYVDFYSSLHHATNLGRIFRPDGDALPPNWRHIPIAYHGRAGTVVVSGTRIARPAGVVPDPGDGVPHLAPTSALDFELEVAFVVGGRTDSRIRPDDAGAHVFGAVLCNDWSARDIQRFEYQPLGPNLGKSFATTISPWVVTLDALRPYLVPAPIQEPEPDPYLRATKPWALDLHLEVDRNGTTITSTNFAANYWTFAQQLAHMTVNGATTRSGDVFASGTVSGPSRGERGSLIEQLADGTATAYLADGDTVTLRGWCGGDAPDRPRIGFGEASGTVVATLEEV